MSFRSITICCVALAAAWVVSVGNAQSTAKDDPATRFEHYTAFPALKNPIQVTPDRGRPEYDKLVARLEARRVAIARAIAEDAPPLHKVRQAQLVEGFAYIKNVVWNISIGRWNDDDFTFLIEMCFKVHHLGADLSEVATEKVKWLEDGVVMLKFIEYYAYTRVDRRTTGPQTLNLARFYRFQAEAELIQLKEQIDKAKQK